MTSNVLYLLRKFANFCRVAISQTQSHRRIGLAVLGSIFWGSSHALPTGFAEEAVLTGLTEPVHLASLPNNDGRMFVLESTGIVKMFNPSDAVPSATPILSISDVANANERGAVSITLDPDFDSNGFFYVYYTHVGTQPEIPPGNQNGSLSNSSIRNRISRFTFDGVSSAGSEVLVWEDNRSVFFQSFHFGGGLDFGPDGMLYLATGEEFVGAQSQDLKQAGGKILRLDMSNIDTVGPWVRVEGANFANDDIAGRNAANTHIIPSDNPSWPAGSLNEIWATGLRNPFRLYWDLTPGGRMYVGEVGGNDNGTATEDLHIGIAGADYGWPDCQGTVCSPARPGAVPAVYHFTHPPTPGGAAIVAGPVSRGSAFPASYEGAWFFGDYVNGTVSYLLFNPDGTVASDNAFATGAGNPVGFEFGPDGALYAVDIAANAAGAGRVIRYVSDGERPVINSAGANPTVGPVPLNVAFSASATNPGNDALQYLWNFGDGNSSTQANPSHSYTVEGNYSAQLTVSNAAGTSISPPIAIQVGTPPAVSITSPVDGSTFRALDEIDLAAEITNPTAGPYTYNWTILFTHNSHTHPALSSSDPNDSFTVSDTGHDYLGDTGFNIALTVTDSIGLSSTAEVDIAPEKVDLNLQTIPTGLNVFVDGLPYAAPMDYGTVIGFNHVISVAATVCENDTEYQFSSWSNGGDRSQALIVPDADLPLTASYVATGACDATIPGTGLVTHFEADSGVSADATGVVSAWTDQSGAGNDLSAIGDPTLLSGGLNGQPVIDFDGVGDALTRATGVTGLPTGASDRTIFAVVKYDGPGYGGVSYGAPGSLFGLGVAANTGTPPSAFLTVLGWGSRDTISSSPAVVDGSSTGWMVQSVVVSANNMTHYRDGVEIDTRTLAYNTSSAQLVLGSEIDGAPNVDMQLAAVAIYDNALSESERSEVRSYLQNKYFGGGGGNTPPVANADTATVVSSESVTFSVTANDTDTEGSVDGSTIVIVSNGSEGTASANPDGTVTYTHTGTGSSDSFTYRVDDDSGATSNLATVTINIIDDGLLPQAGLVLHLESDAQVVTGAGSVVLSWGDQSGSNNSLDISAGNPTLVSGVISGQSVIDFDGVGDKLERSSGQMNLPLGASDRTLIAVVNYRDGSNGGAVYGTAAESQTFGLTVASNDRLAIQGFGAGIDEISREPGVREGWLVQSAVLDDNQLTHYRDSQVIDRATRTYNTIFDKVILGEEIDSSSSMDMQIAAFLIYDRALSASELDDVQTYLQTKYLDGALDAIPPVAANDIETVMSGASIDIDVLGNDTDLGGVLDVLSVVITSGPNNGIATPNSDGTVNYINNGNGENDLFTYTVADDSGNVSNEATVYLSTGNRVSDGLEALYTFDAGSGTTVFEQTGNLPGLDLTIADPGAVSWGDGTLTLTGETQIKSNGPATSLTEALSPEDVVNPNQLTVEAWITTSDLTQTGPARIVSLSEGPLRRNFTLSQDGSGLNVRLRTNAQNANGNNLNGDNPSTDAPQGSLGPSKTHLVYTRGDGEDEFINTRIYVNGVLVESRHTSGEFFNWSSAAEFILGNEVGGTGNNSRPWFGELDLKTQRHRSH